MYFVYNMLYNSVILAYNTITGCLLCGYDHAMIAKDFP